MDDSQCDLQPYQDLITIAIDFGTTFSDAAGSWTGNPGVEEIIQDWPDKPGSFDTFTDEKVATKLAYGINAVPIAWGKQVDIYKEHYQEFKLSLGGVKSRQRSSSLVYEFPDTLGLPLSHQFNATKLTIDFLRCMKTHVLATIAQKIGSIAVDDTPIEWTMTIPAIWSEAQKQSTRFAAENAGMKGRIHLVAEPEAAAIYAIDSIQSTELSKGDTFVLCDCRGSTVDLITYTIDEINPVRVREVVKGDGDRCGGTFVDRIFAKYMTDNFSRCIGWSSETLASALEKFETTTKRRFDDSEDGVLLKAVGLLNDRHKNIKKEKITVPSSDIRTIFEPVVHIIMRLIQEQISASQARQHTISSILLVGGFGQSPYLKRVIEQNVPSTINVWQVKDGRTAIVKGALSKSVYDREPEEMALRVVSRIARRFYGVSMGILFRPRDHDEQKKYFVDIEKAFFVQIAHWLIKKGAAMVDKKHTPLKYFEAWPVSEEAPTFRIHVLAWDDEDSNESRPPHYDDPALHIATLEVKLSRIPPRALEKVYSKLDDVWVYQCHLEIRVTYGSAGLEYALWYRDVCYGTVEADYE